MTGSDDPDFWATTAYALRHPRRALRYAGFSGRDALLGLKSPDHLSYYRAAMRSGSARNPYRAVGSRSREEWLQHGQLQFDYLLRHGLGPSDRVLEIGCGNLRAGRLLIDYLDPGNYYGLDISPEILVDGQRAVAEFGLQAKLPHLAVVSDLTFGFLPSAYFSVVHAHSVFSHSPRRVIGECLSHVGRVMAPGAFFDFTFHRTDGAEYHMLGWAFYYRSDSLLSLARSHGLEAQIMTDWKRLGGPQSKIRVTVPSLARNQSTMAAARLRVPPGLADLLADGPAPSWLVRVGACLRGRLPVRGRRPYREPGLLLRERGGRLFAILLGPAAKETHSVIVARIGRNPAGAR